MSEPHFLRNEQDGVLEIVFNRPSKYNAITNEMYEGLVQAVKDLELRTDLRVMLIRANGKYFSSGTDLSNLAAPEFNGSTTQYRRHYRDNAYHWLFDAMEAVEKPIVVAHHAGCLGGALEMSLSCDFRLAAESAFYELPEMNIGMIAGSGGTSRLVRLVGTHWARWLLLAGERVPAQQALQIGLVHQVVADEELESRAWAFSCKLAQKPPEVMSMAKLAVELVHDLDRSQGRNVERLVNSTLYFGEERKAQMAALLARMAAPKTGN